MSLDTKETAFYMKTALSVLCGILLMFTLAGTASANQWSIEKVPIPVGEQVEVVSAGTIVMKMRDLTKSPIKTKCAVTGIEVLLNTGTKALDETRGSVFDCEPASCGAVTVNPVQPWPSELTGLGDPFYLIVDEAMEVSCGTTNLGLLSGVLKTKVGDFDCPGQLDDVDNEQNYPEQGQGVLSNNGPWTVFFADTLKFGVEHVNAADGELSEGEPCEPTGKE